MECDSDGNCAISDSPIENTFQNETQKIYTNTMKQNVVPYSEGAVCEVCNKDFGQITLLESHILKEHSALIEEMNPQLDDETSNSQATPSSKFDCPKCQKSFPSYQSLDQHLLEFHLEPKPQIRNGGENVEISPHLTITGERPNVHTPTSSFCDICKKELCNKYFMKTHMQRMHGISIENGAHIGGVVCDICNKELCSKYFLRVHKQNSHGIVEEAFLPQINTEIKSFNPNSDAALRPTENELSNRYFSHFTEVCTICNRRFRSTKWLKAHLLNDHGDEGKDKWKEFQTGNKQMERLAIEGGRKPEPNSFYPVNMKTITPDIEITSSGPSTSDVAKIEHNSTEKNNEVLSNLLNTSVSKQYQCSYCHFSTSVLALLFVHERSHIGVITETKAHQCPLCMTTCESNEMLEKHLILHQANNYVNEKRQEIAKISDNTQFAPNPKKEIEKKDDNNYTDVQSKLSTQMLGEAALKCFHCPYTINQLDLYMDHMKNEHKIDEINASSLQLYRDALLQVANSSLIPASFAIPKNFGNFMMQPFVLEDKALGPNTSSTFLSSLVFLPVKERLNRPVTASFKLTPT
jgi:hypothetical protein